MPYDITTLTAHMFYSQVSRPPCVVHNYVLGVSQTQPAGVLFCLRILLCKICIM